MLATTSSPCTGTKYFTIDDHRLNRPGATVSARATGIATHSAISRSRWAFSRWSRITGIW